MIEYIALILGAIAVLLSLLWRSAPSSLLVRQVAELGHEVRHLVQDMELLETKFVALAGKINVQARKPKKDTLDEDDLTAEQRAFLESTIEFQNMKKYNKDEKQ